ncbi:MAG: ABC transporter permease [Sandaracinus sp.]|nr:ABC transporter permease [Myxococcales bacterium]MCB9613425.1 ABC transporter permease [Sandaracinus sp.]
MIGLVARRLARAMLTAVGVVTAVFVLVRAVPGDPAATILGDQASPDELAALRERLHLDDSVGSQYVAFWGDVFNGTLGRSFRDDREVSTRIAEVFPDTIVLALAALFVAWALALPLGILAGRFRGRAPDKIASTVAVLGLAIPNLWLGPLLVLLFGVVLRWLPIPGDDAVGLPGLVLPAITLGTALAAGLTRQTRAAVADALARPYATAAAARGLGTRAVLLRHALPNAALPILTVAGAQVAALLSGTVVVEKIFERDGLGALFLDAFFARDIPVVQGCVLVVALVTVGVNLVVDLLYTAVDPRVRLAT